MNIESLSTWKSFQDIVLELEEERARLDADSGVSYVSDWVFRGQGSASWRLETTLERAGFSEMPVHQYFSRISRARPAFSSLAGRSWDLPDDPANFPPVQVGRGGDNKYRHEVLRFLTYLRHNNFPSPLLDWSMSPYIAAYFAFETPPANEEHVAIFAFMEMAGQGKVGSSSSPQIDEVGPFIDTHERHHYQQSTYTICTMSGHNYDDTFDRFSSHEIAFGKQSREQNVLKKFLISTDCRNQVLQDLERMNINRYTLFGDEEALVRWQFLRQFDIEN